MGVRVSMHELRKSEFSPPSKLKRGTEDLLPRIALLTPYNGGNLGDAAIQDATIANLRLRLPNAEFSGICLNCDHFVEQHGSDAFPLCGPGRPFYRMFGRKYGRTVAPQLGGSGNLAVTPGDGHLVGILKRAAKHVPVLRFCLGTLRALVQESCHWLKGYQFLRTKDLVIVSGGGQLNEEWGGPWGQPFSLFKWGLLARAARIPYVIASVGAGKVHSRTGRFFLALALRLARYRSYRDKNSRAFAGGVLRRAARDLTVPDLAFSLPPSEIPRPVGIRPTAAGRPIVAISPIVFARPGSWPSENRTLHIRYLDQMAKLISALLQRGYFLVIVCSSLGDDESVISEILDRVQDTSKEHFARQVFIPTIASWKEFVAVLLDVDFLIASRLHSVILGFVSETPSVAISPDPKVDWVMGDLGLTDYLLHIGEFTSADVMEALDKLMLRRNDVIDQIATYRDRIHDLSAAQYGALAELAVEKGRHRC